MGKISKEFYRNKEFFSQSDVEYQKVTRPKRRHNRSNRERNYDDKLSRAKRNRKDIQKVSFSGISNVIELTLFAIGTLILVRSLISKRNSSQEQKFKSFANNNSGKNNWLSNASNLINEMNLFKSKCGLPDVDVQGSPTYRVEKGKGKLSSEGINYIKNQEGLYLYAYDDMDGRYPHKQIMPGDSVRGTLTIGYGHTKDVKPGQRITREQADQLFLQDIKSRENYVNQVVKVPVTQSMFDAMVSYVYNTGSLGPNFLRKINSGDYQGAAKELSTKDKHVGIQRRRREERSMFLRGMGNGNILPSSGSGDYQPGSGFSNIPTQMYSPKGGKGLGTFAGHAITSGYGLRKAPARGASTDHRAIDLAYYEGEPLYSYTDGEVTYAGWIGGYGNSIMIYNKGYTFRYSHLQSYAVKAGERVRKGQYIGKAGHTGVGSGTHLDFGIYKGKLSSPNKSKAIDPTRFTEWGPEQSKNNLTAQNNSAKTNKEVFNVKPKVSSSSALVANNAPSAKPNGNTLIKVNRLQEAYNNTYNQPYRQAF